MDNKILRVSVVFISFIGGWGCVALADNSVKSVDFATRSIRCVLTNDYVRGTALKYVGYKIGDMAPVSVHHGTVVDPSYNNAAYNIVIFSANRNRSVVLTLDASDKNEWHVVPNGFFLKRSASGWDVQEGEGGYADYGAVAKFVDGVSMGALDSVKLNWVKSGCFRQ